MTEQFSYNFPILPAGGLQNNPINFLKMFPSAGGWSAPCAQRLSQSLELLCLVLQMIGSWWLTRRNLLRHHAPLQPERQSQVGRHISPHLTFCLLKAYGLILTQSYSMPLLFLPTLMEKSPCGTLCNSSIVRILSSPALVSQMFMMTLDFALLLLFSFIYLERGLLSLPSCWKPF